MNARVSALAAGEGLAYHLDHAHPGNTFNAHRLLHLAAERGLQGAVKERLMRAYFTESERIGDTDTLARLAAETGLDAAEARATLTTDTYAEDVRDDEARAAAFGIHGVPFVVIDERYGVSGAQPTEVFLNALQTAWTATHPLTIITATPTNTGDSDDDSAAGVCDNESCAI